MTGVSDMWQQAATKWNEVSAQITEADWEKPCATCPDWTVRDLVDHAMHWQATGGGALGASTAPGDDWSAVEPALAAALADPANLEGTVESFANMPKQAVAGTVVGDLLIHSWDLARAIGADDSLPAEATSATLMGLQRMPEEMIRNENMFGPALEAAEGASEQDQLLAFVGRQV